MIVENFWMDLKEENSDFVYLGKRIDNALNYIQTNQPNLLKWFKEYIETPYISIIHGELELEEEDYTFDYLDSLLDDIEKKYNIILENKIKMTQEQLRMQFLSDVITESEYKTKLEELNTPSEKDSLNENFIGIGAINNPFADRTKETYEDSFEHFLSERYEVKPNRERDDIKDLEEDKDPYVYESETNEGFVGNFLKKIAQSTGVINDTLTIIDLARKDEEGGAEKAVQMLIDKHGMSEEEALKTVTHVYEKFKPWIELTQRNN